MKPGEVRALLRFLNGFSLWVLLLALWTVVHAQTTKADVPEEAREYVTRGTQLHDEAKYEEALKEYEQAAELAPNWHLPYYEMGYTYWALKEYEPAIRTLQRALELKPDYWLTHVTLGSVLDDVGRREEALPHLERAIELAPDKGKPLYNYAVTLTRLNRLDEAISALQKAEQVEPEYAS
ncbi:MAG: tetratricopeptide repeat protein, partial [Candidatus Acidoferrales bacterium]